MSGDISTQDGLQILVGLIHDVVARLTRLEDKAEAFQARTEAFQAETRQALDTLTQGQSALRRDLGALGQDHLKTRTEIMERIDRLQGKVSAVGDGISVNMHAASRATESVRNMRTDDNSLYDMVAAMQRRQQRLIEDVENLRNRDDRPH